MKKLYWKLRVFLGRWIPHPEQGVGFSSPQGGELSCGEISLSLNVEGRSGNAYLSKVMWSQLGASAGWIPQSEADRVWESANK